MDTTEICLISGWCPKNQVVYQFCNIFWYTCCSFPNEVILAAENETRAVSTLSCCSFKKADPELRELRYGISVYFPSVTHPASSLDTTTDSFFIIR